MRLLLMALAFGLAIPSAKADVCCPSGCVPLYNGTTACVRAGTTLSCGSGSICGGSTSGGGGGGGGSGSGVVFPLPPSSCPGLHPSCTYANGVATVYINNPSGTAYKNPPKYWVYTRLVYAKGCVGAGATLNIPLDGKATLNLFNLSYHNNCTNELPMSFRAKIDSFPDGADPCDCNIKLPAPAYGPATCRQDFVWRNAFDGDAVCVTPGRRTDVQRENANAGATRAGSGAYGPNTCKSGYVWREARPSDVVCVTPPSRAQVKSENATAWDRVAHIAGQ